MVKTVSEFIRSIDDLDSFKASSTNDKKTLKDAVTRSVYIWSDTACAGYCLEAMEAAGIDETNRGIVIDYLYALFDSLNMQEAEERGKKGE